MSNPYDETYRRCIEHARTEMAALEVEIAAINRRLTYTRLRRARLEDAVKALKGLLEIREEAPCFSLVLSSADVQGQEK